MQYGQNRSPSPQHTLNTGNEFFPSNPHVPTVGPTVRYRNHSERKERPVSCRYPSEFERNYFANRQEVSLFIVVISPSLLFKLF